MHLLLRRSQRDDGWVWSSMTFLLDARLDLDAEDLHFFDKYSLYGYVVYDSDARVQHAHSAYESFDAASKPMTPIPWEPSVGDLATAFAEIGATIWNVAAGTTHNVMSMISLQITLGSLVHGQHFESQSLEEILSVTDNIQQATEYLATYLNVALTFDGREDLSEH